MKTLTTPHHATDVLRRLQLLRPDSPRRWGRMSAHQMVCHLRDAFLMGTEQKPVSDAIGWHNRTIVRWIALYAPFPWPKGIQTRPEIDQAVGGTAPAGFADDLASVVVLVERISRDPHFFHGRQHPIFGVLSQRAWMRWAWLHLDHHLRQFGV